MTRLLSLLVLVGGCGDLGTSSAVKPGACSISVTGAVDGIVKCGGETISYLATNNSSLFSLSGGVIGSTTATLETSDMSWNGNVPPKFPAAFSPPAVNSATGSVSQVIDGKKHAWIMEYQPSPPPTSPNMGTFQLSLTGAKNIQSTSSETQYLASGTVQMTLIDLDPVAPQPQITVAAKF